MEQKTIPNQACIAKRLQSTHNTIASDIGDWPMKLGTEIQQKSLQMAGAPVYVYTDCDEDPNKKFDLLLCMPVTSAEGYNGDFETVNLPEFNCVEKMFQGSMPELGEKGWSLFVRELSEKKIKFNNIGREVYVKWVDFNSSENQVLLQMGTD